MAKASVTINLDADLVIEVMVLSGIRNAQDAIEVIVRDYVEKGHRTESIVGHDDDFHTPQPERRDHDRY
jgi:Arc/MetJ family transcription regulator